MQQLLRRFKLPLIMPLFGVIVIDAMSFGLISPILAPLINHAANDILGTSDSIAWRHVVYGFILSLSTLSYAISAPVIGYASDRLGRRKTLLFCIIGSLVGLVCYSYSFLIKNLAILLIGRVIAGASSGSLAVAQSAMADISAGPQKTINIGTIAVAMTIGLVLGPLLGGVLSDHQLVTSFNNATPCYAAIFLTIINIVMLLLFLPEGFDNYCLVKSKSYVLTTELKKFFTNHRLCYLLLTFFFFELGWSLYFQALPLLLVQRFDFSNSLVGIFSSYVGLSLSLALVFFLRVVIKWWSLTTVIITSLVLCALSLAVAYSKSGVMVQYLVVITISLGVACAYTTLVSMASDLVDDNKQGLLMGTTDALLALAFTITGLLSALLAYVDPKLPQAVAAVLMLLAVLLFVLTRRFFGIANC